MRRLFSSLIILSFTFIVPTTYAQQSGGGGSDELKNTCEVSGGTYTGSSGGNWACCWADWGCYGCVDSVCKVKCYNERCRKANGISRPSSTKYQPVDGLAPAGMKAPVVPKVKIKATPDANSMNKTN